MDFLLYSSLEKCTDRDSNELPAARGSTNPDILSDNAELRRSAPLLHFAVFQQIRSCQRRASTATTGVLFSLCVVQPLISRVSLTRSGPSLGFDLESSYLDLREKQCTKPKRSPKVLLMATVEKILVAVCCSQFFFCFIAVLSSPKHRHQSGSFANTIHLISILI